ncbi:MAG: acetyl-CoA carboxylase biotin carboxyl carrier protein subunit, partial [Verrucomicrobiales bacterium]
RAPRTAARAAAPAAAAAPAPAAAPVAGAGDVVSPLAGIVQNIEKNVGDTVAEGDLVLKLEAMKMYTEVTATTAGKITAIHVKTGDAVEEGQPLYAIG